jgi:hypothetical protein
MTLLEKIIKLKKDLQKRQKNATRYRKPRLSIER